MIVISGCKPVSTHAVNAYLH